MATTKAENTGEDFKKENMKFNMVMRMVCFCFVVIASFKFNFQLNGVVTLADNCSLMSDNEPEEERGDDPEREEPENEQTEEKKAPDQAVAGITDGLGAVEKRE
eukprot:g60577.t1